MKRVCLLLLIGFLLGYCAEPKLDGQPLGKIPIDSLPTGCGAQFWELMSNDSAPSIILNKEIRSEWIQINLDGELIQLPRVQKKGTEKLPPGFALGDKFDEVYKVQGILLELKYWVTGVCPEDKPDCGSTDYEGKLEVKRIGKSSISRKLKGNAGC